VLALAGVAYLRPAPVAARAFKLSALPPDKATLMSGQAPVLSPHGSRLSFVAVDETNRTLLYVRSLDSLAAQPLSGTDGASYPFWSPDSRSLGFFANGKLKKIEAAGGQPVTLADAPVGRGGSWNRDGVIIFTPAPTSPINRIPATGGEATAITSVDFARGEFSRIFPQFLPDGRHYLYFSPAAQKPGTRIIGVGSLDSEEKKQLKVTRCRVSNATSSSKRIVPAINMLSLLTGSVSWLTRRSQRRSPLRSASWSTGRRRRESERVRMRTGSIQQQF
jgi:hypothetical protein